MTVDLIYSITFIILYIVFSAVSLFFLIKNFNKETQAHIKNTANLNFTLNNELYKIPKHNKL